MMTIGYKAKSADLRGNSAPSADRQIRERAGRLAARGRALEQDGRYREAAAVLTRTLSVAERAFGPESLQVAATLNDLGRCCKYLARFTEAGPLFQRALAIVERRRGRLHSDVASIYHNLGGLEHAAGNWMRGEPFARESVRIRRLTLGARHPMYAGDLIALAALLDPQRKFAESERLYTRAIRILERACGPDDPEVAVAMNNLGAVHQARGRPRRAEAHYRRALAIGESRLGRHHPKTASFAHNLAVLLTKRGALDEAGALLRRVLSAFRRALGPRHPSVAVALENYAAVLRTRGQRSEAEACLRRAARIQRGIDAVNDDGVALTATINPLAARFRLAVRPSRIDRLGVFAEEAIPAGRLVIEYTGERVARREGKRRWDPKRSYLFQVDDYWLVDGAIGGSGAELINHSCEPNIRARIVRKRVMYFSSRRIARGEELTVDYKYDANLTRMPCHCGAPTCRGRMNLPPERRAARRTS